METLNIKQSKNYREDLRLARRKAAKPMMWIGIVSIVMLFAGLTSAYVVRADNGNWLVFQLPSTAFLSTALIICSSLTLYISQQAIKKNNFRATTLGLLFSFILGIGFFITQYLCWKELTAQGIYFVGKYSNASGSFLYLIAMVHLFHMIGGLISLLVTLAKSVRKKYSADDYLGIELTAIYWHFLDVLWIYLFLFLYFYR
jgi:cytochrome c oxidase subunit III